MIKTAPIALFAYNRPEHTRLTLEALTCNPLAGASDLFIYCDGPKTNASEYELEQIDAVRKLVRKQKWCQTVQIFDREINLGLSQNIREGVSRLTKQYGRAIVLEDDIVTSPAFLDYMNSALNLYEDDPRVGGISGFQIKSKAELPETHFLKKTTSWGWATWQRVWDQVQFDSKDLLARIQDRDLESFNFKYSRMDSILQANMEGRTDSWAICFYASTYLAGLQFLYPWKSLCSNVGFGESATHTKSSPAGSFSWQADELLQQINIRPIPVEECAAARKAWEAGYKLNADGPTSLQRILAGLGRILNR
jgi:hypothetical protein